jgi:ATPase subunit of ABC transporter with duplicated ATPase domains
MSAASIMLTGLGWSAPDGRILFSDLTAVFGRERTGVVGRNGVGKTTLLQLVSGALKPRTGSVAASGRLATLRQTVQVDPHETVADLFGGSKDLAILQRAEAGAATEGDLAAADWTLEGRMASALARVRLHVEPDARLCALSGGQRTRAALAAALFADPDFLLLDEPTNNLDREGRAAVLALLEGWRAGALVVSHDRELLERMDSIVELTALGIARYGGGWSAYRARKEVELAAARHDLADAEQRIEQVAHQAQLQSERQARRDGAGRRKAGKGDMPRILVGARKARAEVTSGGQVKLAERRRGEAAAEAAAARERIEVLAPLSATPPSTGLASGKEVLRLENVCAGYAPDQPLVCGFSLTITGPERVAIGGANGSGKTTLLKVIAGELAPLSGVVRHGTPLAFLDQTVAFVDPTLTILANFGRLNGGADDNACRAALARFRFRADAALQTAGTLSGGQLLRAGLACVLGGLRPPPLLILDEPTNHLDLDSVEAMEIALAAYDGALVVVSHDEAFLHQIGVTQRIDLDRGLA